MFCCNRNRNNYNNNCCQNFSNSSSRNVIEVVGPAGPQGEIGPQGPAGTTNVASFGSYYTDTEQTVSNTSVPLTDILSQSNMTIDTTTGIVTLENSGIYKVDYGVFSTAISATSDYVAIFVDGVEVDGTQRSLEVGSMTSGSAIITIPDALSTINVQIVSTAGVTLSDDFGIDAYLTLVQISE